MTNADKYLKEGITPEEVKEDFYQWYFGIEREAERIDKILENFLQAPVQPTLTEDERVILKNIDTNTFQEIARDVNGILIVQGQNDILEFIKTSLDLFNHLFQFIKERRRI